QSRPLLLFHDPPTTAIYALSLHDALPISFSKQPDCFFRGPRLLLRHHSGPGAVAKPPQRIQDLLAIQLGFAFAESGDTQELGERTGAYSAEFFEGAVVHHDVGNALLLRRGSPPLAKIFAQFGVDVWGDA